MTEFNSSSFLLELDSFGKPPPQKMLNSAPAKEIAQKLDMINLDKQRKMRGDVLAPSQNGMVKLGNSLPPKREPINLQDAQKWRNDVLACNRPKMNSMGHLETADSAREYARQIAPTINTYSMSHASDSDDDRGTRSSSDSFPSPPSEVLSPHLKVSAHHERKSSDYSSASSQKSPSPPSQYSDYASLYKSATSSPSEISPRMDSPTKNFNSAFRNAIPVVSVSTGDRFSPVTQANRSSPTVVPITSAQPRTAKPNFGYGPSLTQQVRVVEQKPPSGRPPSFRPLDNQDKSKRWRDIEIESSAQDERLKELSRTLHENLVMDKRQIVGTCYHCSRPMYDTEDRYTVNEKTYHSRCFCCEVCGRELRDQQFYQNDGRLFCKLHYFHEQLVPEKRTPLCSACRQPLESAVLSALGKKFHPGCFQCHDCRGCLDGVPFSVGRDQDVYCMPCYHSRFAPRCTTCKRPITPDPETGETTRIVALDNNYHVECYVCEGCKTTFDDDHGIRCYPLGRHLLCENCHRAWSRSGGEAPITDL